MLTLVTERVLITLCSMNDSDLRPIPMSRLSNASAVSIPSCRRACRDLAALRLIKRERPQQSGRNAVYSIWVLPEGANHARNIQFQGAKDVS